MPELEADLDSLAAFTGFSGVIRVDRGGRVEAANAYGLAERAYEIPNTVETQFAIASGTKALTALVIVSMIEDGLLELFTPARSVLGRDLPLIADEVTIEHLLAHRSGIGDYLDEEAGPDLSEYLMPVPVQDLATTEQYLAVLDGQPTKFSAGERFAYSNSGYVVLALIAERVAGQSFHDLVDQRVCQPAGMNRTAFLRADELPGGAAFGYVEIDGRWRTNVFHLPVRGSGDGGAYSTAADITAFWRALFAGEIVPDRWLAEMFRPRSDVPSNSMRYGLGFWVHASTETVVLEGCDAGVSFRTEHDPAADVTWTVISNTSDGAWPIARHLIDRFDRKPN
jgi:CubicO group peptidase (beta-lactamase class C family)